MSETHNNLEVLLKSALKAISPRLFSYLKSRLHKHTVSYVNYEFRLITNLCETKKTSIDIGAHAGLFTDLILEHSKSVIAFEPIPFLASKLREKYSEDNRVTIFDCALSDKIGSSKIRVPVNFPGCSTLEVGNEWLANLPATESIVEYEVETKRLDGLNLDNIGFVKIDVEGHEQAVIRGAETTLHQHKPSLYVEIDEDHITGCFSRAVELLNDGGYLGYFMLQDVLLPTALFSTEVFQSNANAKDGKIRINNFFFFHADEIQNVKKRCRSTTFFDNV